MKTKHSENRTHNADRRTTRRWVRAGKSAFLINRADVRF